MSDEEERWHVRIAPGEIKLLTLEQIDDLFRLEMIDGDTLLRQEGSEDWMRLRVVAGLDDEEPAPPVAPSAPPPRVAPPPAPSVAPPVAPASLRTMPVAVAAPVRSAPPPPPPPVAPAPVRSAPPAPPPPPLPPPVERAPFAPSPSFVPPPPSVRGPSAAPPPPVPSVARAPASAAAVSFSPTPSIAPPPVAFAPAVPLPSTAVSSSRAGRGEVLIVGLAALLGLLLTLHRNGAVAALFASAGQAAAYERLEATLGGPGSGTPRAVEALVRRSESASGSARGAQR